MPDPIHVLVADGDPISGEALTELVRESGAEPILVNDLVAAIDVVRLGRTDPGAPSPAVLLFDPVTVDDSGRGLELLATLASVDPALVPVVVTGFGTVEQAVESMRLGAADYLMKPVNPGDLARAVERAHARHALRGETRRRRVDAATDLSIIGDDQRMQRTLEVVDAVAASRTTVLMNGESGTGKSMIAREIHRRSDRADGPFVEIACGSIPETLLESELFGHMKGAFTGAHTDKPGRFRAAEGGTLFLDEINSASPGMQLKLLRVLQERTFEPVGSNEPVEVDVRVVLASNQSLERLVSDGQFRPDLYYRIAVVVIDLPPLRDRPRDVGRLAEHFLIAKAAEAGRTVVGFDDKALAALERYAWPGNVRELENVVERAVVLARSATIGIDDLPEHVAAGRAVAPGGGAVAGFVAPGTAGASGEIWTPGPGVVPLRDAMLEPERLILLHALEQHAWNRQATADALGINRTTLYKKMRDLGLDREAA